MHHGIQQVLAYKTGIYKYITLHVFEVYAKVVGVVIHHIQQYGRTVHTYVFQVYLINTPVFKTYGFFTTGCGGYYYQQKAGFQKVCHQPQIRGELF
jgi:hypothetical protein